jgi:hypothetical protein
LPNELNIDLEKMAYLNATGPWWDGLEGDTLACRPTNSGEPNSALTCVVLTRFIPAILLGCALSCFYIAWLQRKLANKVNQVSSHVAPNAGGSAGARRKKRVRIDRKDLPNGRHGVALALAWGMSWTAWGLGFAVHGYGTVYASDSVPGRVGDAFCKSKLFDV